VSVHPQEGKPSRPEHAGFAERVGEIAADLQDWAERFPVLDSVRFPAIALTVTAHIPELERRQQTLAAAITAWIFAFDEAVDRGRNREADLEDRAMSYKMIVRDQMPSPAKDSLAVDQLARLLVEIRKDLATYRSFESLSGYWQCSFERMIDGILRERRLGNDRARSTNPNLWDSPTFDSLMETARHSIGVPHYLATCFILYEDATIVDRLPQLMPIVRGCAEAVRLANDLQTWQKEEIEQTLNTVVVIRQAIGQAEPALSLAECQVRSIEEVRQRLASRVEATLALLASSPVPSGRPESGIARLVRFVPEFYARHDYHPF
jgi:hypothetical protein